MLGIPVAFVPSVVVCQARVAPLVEFASVAVSAAVCVLSRRGGKLACVCILVLEVTVLMVSSILALLMVGSVAAIIRRRVKAISVVVVAASGARGVLGEAGANLLEVSVFLVATSHSVRTLLFVVIAGAVAAVDLGSSLG